MNLKTSWEPKPSLRSIYLLSVALTLCLTHTGMAQSTRPSVLTTREIAQKASASVVMVVAEDSTGKSVALGSGFFVKDNLIATSFHVIRDARLIKVKLVGQRDSIVVQEVARQDRVNDLALLKVEGLSAKALPLSNGAQVDVGDDVFVHGNPEGFEGTFSQGIVSALRENARGGRDYIQITAPISPGSSGAPVMNNRGEVIGVVAGLIEKGQNLNFAIPEIYLRLLLSPPLPTLPVPIGDPQYRKYFPRERRVDEPARSPEISVDSPKSQTESWFDKGKAYVAQEKYLEAIEAFNRALHSQPNNAEVHMEIGRAYLLLDRNQEGLGLLRKAIQLDNKFIPAYRLLGLALVKMKRSQEGLAEINRAIKMNPDDAISHGYLGNAYQHLHRWQEAIAAYKQAIRLKPDDADSHAALGNAYRHLNRWQEAITTYKQAIRLNPDDSDLHVELGRAYYILKRYEEGMAAVRQAIRINSNNPFAYYTQGMIYADLDQDQQAIQAFKQAIRVKPDFAYAHQLLGIAYLNVGDDGNALEQYKILKRLDTKLAEELFNAIYK